MVSKKLTPVQDKYVQPNGGGRSARATALVNLSIIQAGRTPTLRLKRTIHCIADFPPGPPRAFPSLQSSLQLVSNFRLGSRVICGWMDGDRF